MPCEVPGACLSLRRTIQRFRHGINREGDVLAVDQLCRDLERQVKNVRAIDRAQIISAHAVRSREGYGSCGACVVAQENLCRAVRDRPITEFGV